MIYQDCENLIFENCTGTHIVDGEEKEGFYLDIEPAETENRNIIFKNCTIYSADLLENQIKKNLNKNVSFYNCTIHILKYDGASVEFNNCIIDKFDNGIDRDNINYLGNLVLNNSATFGKNCILDPYIDCPTSVSSNAENRYWRLAYAETSPENAISSTIDNDGIFTIINPSKLNANIKVSSRQIALDDTQTYFLQLKGKVDYGTNTSSSDNSQYIMVEYYNSENNLLKKENCSCFRKSVDSTELIATDVCVCGGILTPPERNNILHNKFKRNII